MNAYDASYIGIAEQLGAPLLTGDNKFRGAHDAEVIVYRTARGRWFMTIGSG